MSSAPSHHEDVQAQPPEELTGLELHDPKTAAAGVPAVLSSLKHVYGSSGLGRGTAAMLGLNQKDGFDCPSCAWPDPDDHRAAFEFCENGAKAIASETTRKRVNPEFMARHSVAELSEWSDYELDQAGRLTEPMVLREEGTHYEPISWGDAFKLVAQELKALPGPDDAVFYTSGRASNEAAFLYQLFARQLGTNNLPDCSNMCHESSGAALNQSVGVGKGTVRLSDLEQADTILIMGQNPGTNHPRMLSTLQVAVENGATVIGVNPMKEAGLTGFMHPQQVKGVLGMPTPLASQFLQVQLNGDQALLKGMAKTLIEDDTLDRDFIAEHTDGFETYEAHLKALDWQELVAKSGLDKEAIQKAARSAASGRRRLITCWAMGLTQHKNAVATIQEVVNLHLLLGAIGREGAGLCPVRGHSNVQGDRTMGVFEKMPEPFLDKLDAEFGFTSPRKHGWDTVNAIRAMHDEPGKVFYALGGNFLQATPDTEYTARALRNCRLTVQISTKLNRSHLVTGRLGLILPCYGRSEAEVRNGMDHFVTVEDSMSVVHASQGKLEPASDQLLSEPVIVARTAAAALGDSSTVSWLELVEDYDRLRDRIERVVPGFEKFNQRVRQPGGFYLPNTARERVWKTESGKAEFRTHELQVMGVAKDRLLLQTLRSHDQFNTTVYGLNDRYRGIGNERRVLFMNPGDMTSRKIEPVKPVTITSHFKDDAPRVVKGFLAIPYDVPAGSCAAYFPEANALVPIDSFADVSLTPTSKSVEVSVVAE